jgi:hypothetical protein
MEPYLTASAVVLGQAYLSNFVTSLHDDQAEMVRLTYPRRDANHPGCITTMHALSKHEQDAASLPSQWDDQSLGIASHLRSDIQHCGTSSQHFHPDEMWDGGLKHPQCSPLRKLQAQFLVDPAAWSLSPFMNHKVRTDQVQSLATWLLSLITETCAI